jgi:hypothetical protein
LQTSDGQEQPALRKEAAFRTKNPDRKWPIMMCIALSTKILHITDVSCRILFDNPATQDYKGWEAEGLDEEAKVCFTHFSYFASSAPSSSTVPGPP